MKDKRKKKLMAHMLTGGIAFVAFCVAVWGLCCIVEMLGTNTVTVGTAAVLFLCCLGALFLE